MRSTVLFSQLALFASTTHAFYPWAPDWLKEEWASKRSLGEGDAEGVTFSIRQRAGESTASSPERVARQAARLASKYGRHQLSQPSTDVSLAKRENVFSIMEAVDPSRDMTIGVNQDGTDYSYFIQVQLGSKGKEFQMLVDTGAGSSWVMGSDCTTTACTMHDTFGPKDSTSFEEHGESFTIKYGTGDVNGTLATDKFTVADLTFDYQIGVAGWTSNDFTQFAFDGILGFSGAKGSNENLLEALGKTGKLSKNLFCVALHRAADGINKGEISFGSINKARHSGEVSYTPTVNADDWAVEIEDMSFDGKKAGVGGVTAYVDTGTSFIFGAPRLVEKLHSVIPGAESSDGRTWRVPCDTLQPLAFTFSGVDYQISRKDWISPVNSNGKCTSNIYGIEIVPGAWLLGDTFLKNVYAVFDRDSKQIGFAPLVGSGGEVPEAATSVTSTKLPSKTPDPSASSMSKSSSSAETQKAASATSAPESGSDSGPSLGLGGHETTAPEETGTSDGEKPEETGNSEGGEKDQNGLGQSAAPGRLLEGVKYSTMVCMGAMLALLI